MGFRWDVKYALRYGETGGCVRECKRKSVGYLSERGNVWSGPLSGLNLQRGWMLQRKIDRINAKSRSYQAQEVLAEEKPSGSEMIGRRL